MNTAINFIHVVKRYGNHEVLSGVTLQIKKGEFLGLVGVNGAGKTTLIKSMLDFTSINSGSISIFGQAATSIAARKNIAYLPERFIPPYYLTGRDFLNYMSELYQEPFSDGQIRQMLSVLDLDSSALNKPVRQFSKGMSQKLGLAACLLSNKDLLILDEPMSGLDPKARAYLKQYLLQMKDTGKTVFFSTHLLTDVEALCDRVAILHEGTIRFAGTPAACCNQHNTEDFEQAYLMCVEEGR